MQSHLGDEGLLLVGKNGLLGNFGSVDIDGLLRFLSRSNGEGGHLLGRLGNSRLGLVAGRRATLATQHLLDLAGVVAGVLLTQGGDLLSLLLGDTSDLGSLSLNDVASVLEMLIDQLLIGDVDQREHEGEHGANDSKTPIRDQLGKVVADEGEDGGLYCQLSNAFDPDQRKTYSNGSRNVLHKQDALCLDDDKVDELVRITDKAVNGLTRHSVVPARAKLSGKALVKQELANHLGRDGNTQSHP